MGNIKELKYYNCPLPSSFALTLVELSLSAVLQLASLVVAAAAEQVSYFHRSKM